MRRSHLTDMNVGLLLAGTNQLYIPHCWRNIATGCYAIRDFPSVLPAAAIDIPLKHVALGCPAIKDQYRELLIL